MRADSKSIQQLLVAEKKSDEKIELARKRKAARLKQAKEEALDEMHKFRQEKENEFKEYEDKHLGSRENIALKLEVETTAKLNDMNRDVGAAKYKVIAYLLEQVLSVNPRLHQNLLLQNSRK